MNAEQDNFEKLRHLLILKRYEQPPPRFFNQFSQQVIIRIQAGERVDHFSVWQALSWDAPWLQRFWNAIETRPVLAGSFGVAICGFLLTGMLYSGPKDAPIAENLAVTMPGQRAPLNLGASAPAANPFVQRVSATPVPGMPGFSASPDSDSLFQQFRAQQSPQVQLLDKVVPQ